MRRYVSVKRSPGGKTIATVSLIDGDISASWSATTYLGEITEAVETADKNARQALHSIKVGVDRLERKVA